MRRFLSQTGEWEKLVGLPSSLPLARRMVIDHAVLDFADRLWWVNVSWGAISADPLGDRPELRFVEAPQALGRHRRMPEWGPRGEAALRRGVPGAAFLSQLVCP
uniref:DUF1618 domain-containing protein n=1 Tax=Setaria italica TaxID=4555 RepID=K3ZGU9_SETIT